MGRIDSRYPTTHLILKHVFVNQSFSICLAKNDFRTGTIKFSVNLENKFSGYDTAPQQKISICDNDDLL